MTTPIGKPSKTPTGNKRNWSEIEPMTGSLMASKIMAIASAIDVRVADTLRI